MVSLSIAAALLVEPALACGGFACDNAAPVLQAAERVVFGIDEAGGEVEMHVQIAYQGASDDFAWIVPVPADPELFVTTSLLFTRLALSTQPNFSLTYAEEGDCERPEMSWSDAVASTDGSGDDDDSTGGFDVSVVAQQVVGPYEAVTLHAVSADDLIGWLVEAGYDLPATLTEVLAPYVSNGSSFVALKLASGFDTGDLAPLGLRYRGTEAVIPIQLTSVSAIPDMRVEAYVLGTGRGVPTSYLHVTPNDLAVDWWSGGSNYDDVITEAANEAGGHAFATDFYGDRINAALLNGTVPEARMREATSWREWLDLASAPVLTVWPELFAATEDILGLAPGDGARLWGCPSCWDEFPRIFDANAATDAMMARVFGPLLSDQALLERYPHLTRMTSSLDAIEMTVDPVFTVNHDLAGTSVSTQWSATQRQLCGKGTRIEKAPQQLDLDRSGLSVALPSAEWLYEHSMTEFEYIEELRENNAVLIEQMGPSGEPEVVVDHRPGLAALVDEFNQALQGRGCGGCATGRSGGGLGLLAAAVLAWGRRRSPRCG